MRLWIAHMVLAGVFGEGVSDDTGPSIRIKGGVAIELRLGSRARAMLTESAGAFKASADELLELKPVKDSTSRRSARFLNRLKRIEHLSPGDQRAVFKSVDALVASASCPSRWQEERCRYGGNQMVHVIQNHGFQSANHGFVRRRSASSNSFWKSTAASPGSILTNDPSHM